LKIHLNQVQKFPTSLCQDLIKRNRNNDEFIVSGSYKNYTMCGTTLYTVKYFLFCVASNTCNLFRAPAQKWLKIQLHCILQLYCTCVERGQDRITHRSGNHLPFVIQTQGYIIRILQQFATKLWNITNFVMLFQAVMKILSRLVEIKTLVNNINVGLVHSVIVLIENNTWSRT
jgi:hypothetical protein